MDVVRNNEVTRKGDELGRVVLPFEFRCILDIQSKSDVKLTLKDNGIFLERVKK